MVVAAARSRARRAPARVLVVLGALTALLSPAAALAAGDAAAGWTGTPPAPTVHYRVPVPGEVVRPFEPPGSAFGPGHRGVDLAAAPGDGVAAAAAGTVRHAGPVAGVVWVSVEHADGLVTTYGPLTRLTVRAGAAVAGGEVLGRLTAGGHGDGGADHGLHWGARRGPHYLDPLSLLDRGVARPSLVGSGGWDGTAFAVEAYEPWRGARWGGVGLHGSPVAQGPGFAVAPNPNHLMMVSGWATVSGHLPIDPEHLGYDPRSVTALSYAGRDPVAGSPSADPWRDQLPYAAQDTWSGVPDAAARLEAQLRAHAAREPGRAVDLVGHSMGGVALLYYLAHHHDPYDPGLPQIGHVVTVGSPLRGSDLASLAKAIDDHASLGPSVELWRRRIADGDSRLAGRAGRVQLGAPAIDQLRVGAPLLGELAAGWASALADGPAGPLATGTRVLTIGGAGDRAVAAARSAQPGTGLSRPGVSDDPVVRHRVLPGDHAGMLRTEAVREVVWRFLAGEEVVDSPGRLATFASREHGRTLRLVGGLLRLEDALLGPGRPAPPPGLLLEPGDGAEP